MLKKRLTGNIGANLFAQGVNVVAQLGSVSLFLACWNKQRYGEWLLISAIPSYLSLADAGFATFSGNEVSMLVSKGDLAGARRSLHTAWGFLIGISLVIGIAAWAALALLPWQAWLNISLISTGSAQRAITLLCLYTVIGLWMAIYGTVYRGAYRNARYIYLANCGRLLEFGVTAICVYLSQSVVVVAAGMLCARVLTMIGLEFDSRRFADFLRVGLFEFSRKELSRTWRSSSMFMVFALGNAFYFQGLTLLAGRMLGPAAVVIFNTTRALTRVMVQFVTIIKHSVWPEFSYLFGKGELVKARRLNGLAFECAWVAVAALSGGLYLIGPWVMRLWTHGAVEINRGFLSLFLISAGLNSLWFICSGLLMGANHHEGLARRYVIATAGSLLCAIPLVYWLGIHGIAIAMILCELVLLPYTLKYTCALLDQSVSQFALDALRLRTMLGVVSDWRQTRKSPSHTIT